MNPKYEDMAKMPHHQSIYHPHMSNLDRAAQFMPFAALTGFGESISEEGRLTSPRPILSEDSKKSVQEKLFIGVSRISSHPRVELIYFEEDLLKGGGSVNRVEGKLEKYSEYDRFIQIDGKKYSIDDILDFSVFD